MARYFKNKWFLLFLLIPFFKPVCLQYYSRLSMIETTFVVWKIVSALIGIEMFVIYIWKHAKIPKLVVLTALFEGSILLSTILNHGYVVQAVIDAVSIMAFVVILTLGIKFHYTLFIHVFEMLIKTLMWINLFSICCFPEGLPADLYTNQVNALYFMVVDNGSALFLAFCILIFILDGFICNGYLSKKHKLSIAACFFSALLSQSATAIVLLILLIVVMVLLMRGNISPVINPQILFFVYICLFIFLITMQDNVVTAFILNYIFGRSSNFTGRYILWEQAEYLIAQKPLIGYGRSMNDYISAWGGYYSSHNYVLEILLQGGAIALFSFVRIILSALKRVQSNKFSKYILLVLWGMLIAAMMESTVHSVYIFGAICFCYYSKYFQEKEVGSS